MKRAGDFPVYLILLLAVLCAYLQVHDFAFIKYDDDEFVAQNAHLLHLDFRWAFTSLYAANWLPLTWISYMLGIQLYGLDPGWHHLTNVLLHAIGTLLLFAVLKRMTGARWRSAFVAFCFALHPLHVEPVAWISERKEVLSGVFWFLTIGAYAGYARRPSLRAYLPVAAMLGCALLSKPMAVTLPLVLFLLDIWPLDRFKSVPIRRLLSEKLPLLALSAAASVITLIAQQRGGAVSSVELIPLAARLENALISYVVYVYKFLWPANISLIYPFRFDLAGWQAVGAALILILLTAFACTEIKRRPYITAGWLWFMGTLAPVIGIVQVGAQSRADRYTYIPFIGLSIIAAWGLAEIPYRSAAIAASVAVCAAWFAATCVDVGYWRDSIAIFEHALQVTGDNWIAQNGLAQGLLAAGRTADAIPHLEQSLRINPNVPESHVILGEALSRSDRLAEAAAQFAAAVQLRPDNPDAQEGLGMALTDQGRFPEARAHLLEAIRLRPQDADSHYNLGRLFGLSGQAADAVTQFAEAARLKPDDAAAHYNLANALAVAGRIDQAYAEFRVAIELRPNYAEAHLSLARLYASQDRCRDALPELRETLRLQPDSPEAHDLLATCSR